MTADPNLLKGNLELILLSILEHSEMYGLEIIEEANTQTDGYLHRLTQQGFLTASFKPSPRGGMPSRYYAISQSGRPALEEKRRAFQQFNQHVETLWRKP
jgi:PadR family transcriptional regulator, regulatory protein PadR